MAEFTHVKGLSELHKFLQTLPAKIEQNVMRGALTAGAVPIRDEAKSLAPVAEPSRKGKRLYGLRRGSLRDSIRTSSSRAKNGRVTAGVKVGGKSKKTGDVFFAHIVEYTGAVPHMIGKTMHPGMRPRPFMRPALDKAANKAVLAAGNYIKRRLATKHGIDTSGVELIGDGDGEP